MTDNMENYFDQPIRGEWVRLRTFIYLRWLAVFGQSGAVIAGLYFLNLDLRLDLISPVILLSASINILATLLYPENKRLSEKDILLLLLYDLVQLSALLFLTGGLTNPFCALVLAPVTISASTLRIRSTLLLGVIATCLISFLGFFYLPLKTINNLSIDADILLIGTWLALLITASFIAGYVKRVAGEMSSMTKALLATQMALEREQKLTALGGVVAAMAHELGTPLSTIKLASSEILSENDLGDNIVEDIKLINSQVDRCRDILQSMGRHGKDDTLVHTVPILSLIQEATEPHQKRGKLITLRTGNFKASVTDELTFVEQPHVARRSEIIHGLRNLVQNAVDFANKNVYIDISWNEIQFDIHIIDDGPGFPSEMLGRIGDPFVTVRSSRKHKNRARQYEGLGLGLFIAKTLLERTGAKLLFANGRINHDGKTQIQDKPSEALKYGAIVQLTWPTPQIVSNDFGDSLPPNKLNEV